jgi:hypothetical protein
MSIDTITAARKSIRDMLNSKSRKQAHATSWPTSWAHSWPPPFPSLYTSRALKGSISHHWTPYLWMHKPRKHLPPNVSPPHFSNHVFLFPHTCNPPPQPHGSNYPNGSATHSGLSRNHAQTHLTGHATQVTLQDLTSALRHLGRNKAGGPFGLTTEMLIHLSPETQEK